MLDFPSFFRAKNLLLKVFLFIINPRALIISFLLLNIFLIFPALCILSLCFFRLPKPTYYLSSDVDQNRGETPLACPRTGVLERACRSVTTTPGNPRGIFDLPTIIMTVARPMAFQNPFLGPGHHK